MKCVTSQYIRLIVLLVWQYCIQLLQTAFFGPKLKHKHPFMILTVEVQPLRHVSEKARTLNSFLDAASDASLCHFEVRRLEIIVV